MGNRNKQNVHLYVLTLYTKNDSHSMFSVLENYGVSKHWSIIMIQICTSIVFH